MEERKRTDLVDLNSETLDILVKRGTRQIEVQSIKACDRLWKRAWYNPKLGLGYFSGDGSFNFGKIDAQFIYLFEINFELMCVHVCTYTYIFICKMFIHIYLPLLIFQNLLNYTCLKHHCPSALRNNFHNYFQLPECTMFLLSYRN